MAHRSLIIFLLLVAGIAPAQTPTPTPTPTPPTGGTNPITNGKLTTPLNANNFPVNNAPSPTDANDLANKAYVDLVASGGVPITGLATSVTLSVPSDLFDTPILFDLTTSDWTATMTKANAPGSTVYGNTSGALGPPGWFTFTTLKGLMSLDKVENTKLSTWAGSANITTLGTITTGTFPAANVSGSIATSQIAANAVTYPKIQNVTGARLLGNSSTTPGQVSEISIAGNLTLSSGVLTGTGGGGGGGVSSIAVGNLALPTAGTTFFTSGVDATTPATPIVSFTLANSPAHKFFGNNTNAAAAPDYMTINEGDVNNLTTDLGNKVTLTTGTTTPVNGEFVLFSDTTGKIIKDPPIAGNGFDSSGNLNFLSFGASSNINFTPGTTGSANLKQAILIDPTDLTKKAAFDLSAFPTATTRVVHIAPSADSATAITSTVTSGQFLTGFNATTGLFDSDTVSEYQVIKNQDNITSLTPNPHVLSPTDGTLDIARLSADVSSLSNFPVTWPPAAAYSPGDVVRFYDATGTISSTHTVTISNSTDTFNGLGNIIISEPYANRTFVAEPGNGTTIPPSWAVSTYSGANNGVNIAYGNADGSQLAESSGVISWSLYPNVTWQNGNITLTANDTLNIDPTNLKPGMHFEILVQQGGAGNFVLTLPVNSYTPSDGKGVIALSPAAGQVTKVSGTYHGALGYLWESSLNYTKSLILSCTTPETFGSFSGTINVSPGNASTHVYTACPWTPATTANVCKLGIPLWKTGTVTNNITFAIYSDASGAPGSLLGTTNTLTPADVAFTASTSTETFFTFPSTVHVTNGTQVWVVAIAGTPLSSSFAGNHWTWLAQSSSGFTLSISPATIAWSPLVANAKPAFKAYH